MHRADVKPSEAASSSSAWQQRTRPPRDILSLSELDNTPDPEWSNLQRPPSRGELCRRLWVVARLSSISRIKVAAMTKMNWDRVRAENLSHAHGSTYGTPGPGVMVDEQSESQERRKASAKSARRVAYPLTHKPAARRNVWTDTVPPVHAHGSRSTAPVLTGAPASMALLREFEASLTPAALTRWTRSDFLLAKRICSQAAEFFAGLARERLARSGKP